MRKREFWVLNYDFNNKKVVNYDIFTNGRFVDGVADLLNEYITFEDFCDKLNRLLRYCFWSKREYEISVGDAFEEDLNKYEKIDIYRQASANLDALAHLIIDYYNEQAELEPNVFIQ